jgi:hypothetical protein
MLPTPEPRPPDTRRRHALIARHHLPSTETRKNQIPGSAFGATASHARRHPDIKNSITRCQTKRQCEKCGLARSSNTAFKLSDAPLLFSHQRA